MHLQPVFRVEAQSSKLKAESKSKNTWSASPGEIRSDKLNATCCDSVNLTRQAVVNMSQLNRKGISPQYHLPELPQLNALRCD